jgi:phosphoribosyl 1,2-cyclic phosphodiesterase
MTAIGKHPARLTIFVSMSLFISSINSGSNGNCYYVGNDREAILVDAGISCRETEKRMKRAGLSIQKVKAIFISHEHSDHIRGVEVLSRKYQLPVYITAPTLGNSGLSIEKHLLRSFSKKEPINIGSLSVFPFFKNHDAADPHSFVVEQEGICIGVFTDIGSVCEQTILHFKRCNAIFLEANYDEHMLATGHYPAYLKKRISSDHGHLSNAQALALFLEHRPGFMSHVLLSHLSKENNDPETARKLFASHAGNTHVSVASRYEEGPVFNITGRFETTAAKRTFVRTEQMSLF